MSSILGTLRNRELRKIYLIPLIGNSTASMTWAIAVLYALDLKATLLQVNLITAIWGTMGIFLQVPFGILSDRFGRKRMLLIPQTMMLLGTTMRALATDPNQLIVASVVGGFAGGTFFPILLSMVGDITSAEERGEAIGTFFFFSSVGMLLGPTVASLILTLPFVQLRTIYQIDSVFQTLVLLYIVLTVKEPEKASVMTGYRGSIAQLLREGGMIAATVMAALYFLYSAIMNNYVPIYARTVVGLSDPMIASFSSYRNLGIMLIRLSSITILARLSTKRLLTLVLVLGGIAGLGVPYTGSYPELVSLMFLYGTSFGATILLGSRIVAEVSEPSNRGVANSINSLAQSSGTMSQLLTTPMAENLGLMPVFTLGGSLSILSVIPITLLYRSPSHGNPETKTPQDPTQNPPTSATFLNDIPRRQSPLKGSEAGAHNSS